MTRTREARDFIAEGVTRREGTSPMALLGGPKVIARVSSSSASSLAVMSFEWIMRLDGQVCYRLTNVDGRAERNPWTLVTQLPPAELHGLHRDKGKAKALLDDLARQHGHRLS